MALLDYTKDTSLVDFETAWGYQREILDDQMERVILSNKNAKNNIADEDDDKESFSSFLPISDNNQTNNKGYRDTIIMLQHNPVYTLGTGSDEGFVKASSSSSVPVVRMDRGGEVTYHGPGQITVYPVLDLRRYKQDIHWYMRALEEAIILAISNSSKSSSSSNVQLRAEREDGVTGVWIENHKVAAVGIKCRRWITQHGLAVNVEESSLTNFGGIVPCGLEGRKVGCLNQFLTEQGAEPITVRDFAIVMKEALEDVFRIELVDRPLMQ